MNELKRQQWTSGELLACALLELLIVNIAYRIGRQRSAPFLSTAAWAILLGVGVSLCVARWGYSIARLLTRVRLTLCAAFTVWPRAVEDLERREQRVPSRF